MSFPAFTRRAITRERIARDRFIGTITRRTPHIRFSVVRQSTPDNIVIFPPIKRKGFWPQDPNSVN